jgi:integrase
VNGVWNLKPSRTKKNLGILIPLAPPVLDWLNEVKVFAANSEYLFPARRLVAKMEGKEHRNRFEHISPDTLNVALRRLNLRDIPHFTVHDMRRTARTLLAGLGVDHFVAERALNHKLRNVEGVYDRHDYFDERRDALGRWVDLVSASAVADGCGHGA